MKRIDDRLFFGLNSITMLNYSKHSSSHSVLTGSMVSTKSNQKQKSQFVVGWGKVIQTDGRGVTFFCKCGGRQKEVAFCRGSLSILGSAAEAGPAEKMNRNNNDVLIRISPPRLSTPEVCS